MMRPLVALIGALALLVAWLGMVTVQARGNPALFVLALGDSAQRSRLPGLAAHAYLLSAEIQRRRLYSPEIERDSPVGQSLIRQIIATRMAAARLLLRSGYVAAAERIALEGARADFDDLQARALLLEVRLRGDKSGASRRELMLMLLNEEQPQLLCLLGTSFAREGNLEDAAAAYERALRADADHVPSLVALAELRAKQGDTAVADTLLQRAATSAEGPNERDLVLAALRRLQLSPAGPLAGARDWCLDHGPSLIVLLVYLLFLISPALMRIIARSGAKTTSA
ncbi:MAG: tetratricopeptide repeat protein [Armatimonadota bacterium]